MGKTCLIALDGFFEWKQESVVGSKSKKKQPYFVYRKQNGSTVDKQSTASVAAASATTPSNSGSSHSQNEPRPFLLMAGLWTRVSTGRADPKMMDTFTIITTEACPCLEWLHTRMPVFVWDDDSARQWLLNPSPRVHEQLVKQARATTSLPSSASTSTSSPQQRQCVDDSNDRLLDWHAVTAEMSTMKYRSADAIKPLPKVKTVKSFFTTAAAAQATKNNSKKTSDGTCTSDNSGEKKLNDKAVASSMGTKPAGGAAVAPSTPAKRPAATISSKPRSSAKKSKTTPSASVKKKTGSSSTTPKKGSIQYFFATKAKAEKT
jgi:hypothetical protein